jgi:hypothetical protein
MEDVDVVEVVAVAGHHREEGAIREIGTRVVVVVPVTEEIAIIVMNMDEVVEVVDEGVEATVLVLLQCLLQRIVSH